MGRRNWCRPPRPNGKRARAHRPPLAFLEAQIQAGVIKYDQAKAHLDGCLALAGDCHAIYMSIEDLLRWIANQAFFDKPIVTPDDAIDGEPDEPFNIFFDPAIHQLRIVISDTAGARPGIDPARLSFVVALKTARDQVIRAANTLTDTTVDLVGRIAAALSAGILPARCTRTGNQSQTCDLEKSALADAPRSR